MVSRCLAKASSASVPREPRRRAPGASARKASFSEMVQMYSVKLAAWLRRARINFAGESAHTMATWLGKSFASISRLIVMFSRKEEWTSA